MDNLDCHGEVVHQTLRELEFINTWLGGNAVTISALDKMLHLRKSTKEIYIADLGCGGGDMLRLIYRWSKKKNITVKLLGIDANPHIISFARDNLRALPQIAFECLDIFSPEFAKRKFDIVIGTLFYHHFSKEQLSTFFRQLKDQTEIGFIMNDIHRHALAFYSIKFLTRWFSRSDMVKNDAPLSVLRAFRREEIDEILKEANVVKYEIDWKWAFRWRVLVFSESRS
jgi:SAM-dependent methyltransferase